MSRTALFVPTVALVMAFAPPAAAQEQETVVTVKTATTIKADRLQLFGRVTAPFSPRGEATIDEDCVGDRSVEVSIRKRSGYRAIGSDLTSLGGRWSVRAKEFGAIYRIRVQPSEFAYSPAYGELEVVRCRATTVIGTLTRRGFRIASVLGTRFGRAEARSGQLPATGSALELYFIGGSLLMAAGIAMVRSKPRAKPRP